MGGSRRWESTHITHIPIITGLRGLLTEGSITRIEPLPLEVKENDRVSYERIAFWFTKRWYGDLRQLIDTLNSYVL